MEINKEVFAKRLAEMMNEFDETIYGLGEYLHLSPATISRYTSAVLKPKITAIESLSSKWNINPAWLMGYDVEKYLQNKEEKFKNIPILGRIAAGQPITAVENIEGYESVLISSKAEYCLKINGDSMINARIFDGDIVFIRPQQEVENGEIAAVMIDGEDVTLKRVYKYSGKIILRSENSKYKELTYDKKDSKEIKILGKCIAVKFWLE